LISVQFYVVSEIGERIREVREDTKGTRKAIRVAIKEARDVILDKVK